MPRRPKPIVVVCMNGGTITSVYSNVPELDGIDIVFTEEDREACDPENLKKVQGFPEFIYTSTSIQSGHAFKSYPQAVRRAMKRYDEETAR